MVCNVFVPAGAGAQSRHNKQRGHKYSGADLLATRPCATSD